MKKCIAIILSILLGTTVYAKEEPGELYAQSAVLMDADSGRILFQKNGSQSRAMASTTKIMTCILALEYGKEQQIVTFSKMAERQPKVHLGATEGEQFYLEDLLHSLMLESHNDSAVAIAESISGTVESFSGLMDKKAKEIGCEKTNFVTPNGLDGVDLEGEHGTTAEDLAKIMRYCIMISPQKEKFIEITRVQQYQFSNLKGSKSYSCTNHNAFLNMMQEAISGKTGYTSKAGYCYVGAVESEGRTFIVSLLGCGWPNHKNYKWEDMKELVTYGMENYEYQGGNEYLDTGQITVRNGIPLTGELFERAMVKTKMAGKNRKILMHNQEILSVKRKLKQYVDAPVRKGEQVGSVEYYLDDKMIFSYPIVAEADIERIDFSWCFQKMVETYLLRKR